MEIVERRVDDGRRLVFLLNAIAQAQTITLDEPMYDLYHDDALTGVIGVEPFGVRTLGSVNYNWRNSTMAKPNIIFILLDDYGWKDSSCYGSEFYETPNIDRLAQEGMRFTNAYASCPVCSPTRASILSGKYPATVGVTDYIEWTSAIHPARGKVVDVPYLKYLPLEEKTIAGTLRDNGYQTWHVGKWHLGGEKYYPQNHGFDVNVGGCEWGELMNGYFSPWGIPGLQDAPDGKLLTDHLTDEAVRLIKESEEIPFFLNLWYYAVHTPIQAKADKIKKYEEKAKAMGLNTVKTFEEGDFFPCEHKKNKRILRRLVQSDPTYAAMIESVDENIGKLMQALEEEGLMDNTVIFFTSDNGGLATAEGSPTSNAPLAEGKGWMYEGGTREPLIVKWPGVIQPGSLCGMPMTSPDIYPTMLEIADLELLPEQHCDGASLLPLLKGEKTLEREGIFWHYPHYGNQGGTPGSSIRSGDYKLIEFFEDGRLELYNLCEDVSEERNLAAELPEVTERLHKLLIKWRGQVEAKIPQSNTAYIPWQ